MLQANRSTLTNGSAVEVFIVFLKLGLTSFGGPIAHIGYFRKALVEQRGWVNDHQFGQLLAICQFLPGPASSQLGFSLGLIRAGWLGAVSAFLAFTLPSVILLVSFVFLLTFISSTTNDVLIHGLKIVAFAVVADGVLGMSKNLCPDKISATIATLAIAILLLLDSAFTQILIIIAGGLAGTIFYHEKANIDDITIPVNYSVLTAWVCLLVFFVLLFGLPLLVGESVNGFSIANTFYQAGSLVFGGGHVVMPLLEDSVVTSGWVSKESFLAGYGASQAIPGPMFAFSAYLGAIIPNSEVILLSVIIAVLFIFLPGFLLVTAALPLWGFVAGNPIATRAIAGANAAVVGLLGAALYDPVFTSAIKNGSDLAIGIIAFTLLAVWRVSPLLVVVWCVGASLIKTYI